LVVDNKEFVWLNECFLEGWVSTIIHDDIPHLTSLLRTKSLLLWPENGLLIQGKTTQESNSEEIFNYARFRFGKSGIGTKILEFHR
jgi:hypothetical protein